MRTRRPLPRLPEDDHTRPHVSREDAILHELRESRRLLTGMFELLEILVVEEAPPPPAQVDHLKLVAGPVTEQP